MAGEPVHVEAWQIIVVIILVAWSALFSGLTLGLLGLDINVLESKIKGDNPVERRQAVRIKKVRKNGNRLLCTLLLGNVAVNAGLSIVMADMTSGTVGFLVSTFVIVVFGEIIPQATCQRYALKIGSVFAPVVQVLMLVLLPATFGLSFVLDWFLGKESGTFFTRTEMKVVLDMHKEQDQEGYMGETVDIMKNVIDFGDKEVHTVMTPMDRAFLLELHQKLNFEVLTEIFKSGYSRIPVYDKTRPRDEVVGILFVKDLILLDPAEEHELTAILNFYGREFTKVWPDQKLKEVLRMFQTNRTHMAVVQDVRSTDDADPEYVNVGLITLEDIIEEILGQEIVDETDMLVDVKDQKSVTTQKQRAFDPSKFALFVSRRAMPTGALLPQEASAVFHHLRHTVPEFQAGTCQLLATYLKHFLVGQVEIINVIIPEEKDVKGAPVPAIPEEKDVKGAPVPAIPEEKDVKGAPVPAIPGVGRKRASSIHTDVNEGGHLLYQRGVATDYFSLILDGQLEVSAGKHGFLSQAFRWCHFCADLLHFSEAELTRRPTTGQAPDLDPYLPDFTAKVVRSSRILRIDRRKFREAVLIQRGEEGVDCCKKELEEEMKGHDDGPIPPFRQPLGRFHQSGSESRPPRSQSTSPHPPSNAEHDLSPDVLSTTPNASGRPFIKLIKDGMKDAAASMTALVSSGDAGMDFGTSTSGIEPQDSTSGVKFHYPDI
eukprot:g61522.t1